MKVRRELNQALYSKKANGRDDDTKDLFSNDYSDICRGDTEAVKHKLKIDKTALQNNRRDMCDDAVRNGKYCFAVESDLLAEAVVTAGMGHDEAFTLADIYVRKADKCADCEQITGLFADMCIDFSLRMSEIKKEAAKSLHIRKCIAYIYGNLNADLSVKGLSAYLGLNSSYLSRLFSKEVGTSVKKFVTKARISTACDLLKNTSQPYIEIAYSLGFSTQSMFIRIFKSETGLTPKKYREKFM